MTNLDTVGRREWETKEVGDKGREEMERVDVQTAAQKPKKKKNSFKETMRKMLALVKCALGALSDSQEGSLEPFSKHLFYLNYLSEFLL